METKEIKIPSSKEKVFFQYVSFINPMIGNLPKKELELLAVILKYNNKYKHIPDTDRGLILFSSKIKQEMINEIGCNSNTFNIYFSKLNKKQIIINDTVNPKIAIYPDDKGLNLDLKLIFVDLNKIKNKQTKEENESREIDTRRDEVSESGGDSERSSEESSDSQISFGSYGSSTIELITEDSEED